MDSQFGLLTHSQIGTGLRLSLRFPYASTCTALRGQIGAAH